MMINLRGLSESSSQPVPVTIGGGTTPNGLRWVTALPATGQPKATGVAIAQVGEWLLKFRVTSLTRDAEAVGKRLDQLIAMVHFSMPPPASLPLKPPAPCTVESWNNGMLMTDAPNDEELAAAMFGATNELAAARGMFGLAKEPDQWCHDESLTIGAGTIGLYRSLREPSEWVMLMGDSGVGVAAQSFHEYAKLSKPKKLRAKAALYVSTTKATSAVALFDSLPLAEAAIDLAMPVAMGQRSGIFSISTDAKPAASSPNQNKDK
jgi:hypothetical protein